jgi:hypothetical protein
MGAALCPRRVWHCRPARAAPHPPGDPAHRVARPPWRPAGLARRLLTARGAVARWALAEGSAVDARRGRGAAPRGGEAGAAVDAWCRRDDSGAPGRAAAQGAAGRRSAEDAAVAVGADCDERGSRVSGRAKSRPLPGTPPCGAPPPSSSPIHTPPPPPQNPAPSLTAGRAVGDGHAVGKARVAGGRVGRRSELGGTAGDTGLVGLEAQAKGARGADRAGLAIAGAARAVRAGHGGRRGRGGCVWVRGARVSGQGVVAQAVAGMARTARLRHAPLLLQQSPRAAHPTPFPPPHPRGSPVPAHPSSAAPPALPCTAPPRARRAG